MRNGVLFYGVRYWAHNITDRSLVPGSVFWTKTLLQRSFCFLSLVRLEVGIAPGLELVVPITDFCQIWLDTTMRSGKVSTRLHTRSHQGRNVGRLRPPINVLPRGGVFFFEM